VKFNLAEKTIDVNDMFNRCLFPSAPNRYWDEGTRDWWSNMPDLLGRITAQSEEPEDVLDAFWLFMSKIESPTPVRFWSKPISFDFPFVSSYMRQFGKNMPLHYRHAKDLNTYIWARGHHDVDAFWKGIPFEGEKHNALHDVINQIKGAFSA
jgi:hypothetical protein